MTSTTNGFRAWIMHDRRQVSSSRLKHAKRLLYRSAGQGTTLQVGNILHALPEPAKD